MKLLIVLSVLLVPLIIVGTLAWWRIGDHWADNEHKRFKEKPRPGGTEGPRVIAPFSPTDPPDNADHPAD